MNTGCFSPKDYAGKRFGISTAIKPLEKKFSDGSRFWIMRCDCGFEFEIYAGKINTVYSCGCTKKINPGDFEKKNLAGIKNEMATPTKPTGKRAIGGYLIWEILCDCGKTFERSSQAILKGYVRSCGCKLFRKLGRPRIENNGSHVNCIFNSYKKGAKERGYCFELTKDDLKKIIEKDCLYCGEPPRKQARKNLSGTYFSNGIDRMNNSIGYTIENCAACCKTCNFMKSKLNCDEFMTQAFKIFNHRSLYRF